MMFRNMKKSDRKQVERAWVRFHDAMNSLMKSMQYLLDIPDDEITVDELNTLVSCISKMDKHLKKMGEVRMLRLKKDYSDEWWRD